MASVIENLKIKQKCQIFTPAEKVSRMLDMAGYEDNLFGKKVLENSCGDGEFLVQIAERYITDAVRHYNLYFQTADEWCACFFRHGHLRLCWSDLRVYRLDQ